MAYFRPGLHDVMRVLEHAQSAFSLPEVTVGLNNTLTMTEISCEWSYSMACFSPGRYLFIFCPTLAWAFTPAFKMAYKN